MRERSRDGRLGYPTFRIRSRCPRNVGRLRVWVPALHPWTSKLWQPSHRRYKTDRAVYRQCEKSRVHFPGKTVGRERIYTRLAGGGTDARPAGIRHVSLPNQYNFYNRHLAEFLAKYPLPFLSSPGPHFSFLLPPLYLGTTGLAIWTPRGQGPSRTSSSTTMSTPHEA